MIIKHEVVALARQDDIKEDSSEEITSPDPSIKELIQHLTAYWEDIDFDFTTVFRKIWKEDTNKVLLIHQLTMLIGELGELLRPLYLESQHDSQPADNGKKAANVLLHALQVVRLLEGSDAKVIHAIQRALQEMQRLSSEYRQLYRK